MQEYNVRIFPAAQHDALSILSHQTPNEHESAAAQYASLMENLEILKTSPLSCPIAKDSQLRYRGYRTLAVNDFVFIFMVRGDTVEIRRVIHSKRQYEHLA